MYEQENEEYETRRNARRQNDKTRLADSEVSKDELPGQNGFSI